MCCLLVPPTQRIRDDVRSHTHRSNLIRIALIAASFSSVFAAFSYGPNGWRSPKPPHVPYVLTVFANFGTALLIGVAATYARPFATRRWRAGLLGAPIWLTAQLMIYWSMIRLPLTQRQFVAYCAFGILVGFIGGFVLWEEDDEDYE